MPDEVLMFNALWLRGEQGREQYQEYGRRVMQLVEARGGGIDYVLHAEQAIEGDFVPDVLAVIRYPSMQIFQDMILSDEYRAIAQLRTDATERAILTRCQG